jgi:hypothetical protein
MMVLEMRQSELISRRSNVDRERKISSIELPIRMLLKNMPSPGSEFSENYGFPRLRDWPLSDAILAT